MEATRKCFRCQEIQPLSCFSWRNKGQSTRQRECKKCYALTRKRHYRANKVALVKATKIRGKNYLADFQQYKQSLKCFYCPENTSVCLDFHHTDPSTKKYAVSSKANNVPLKTLMEEINKCIVVCKNCHAKLHAGLV